MILIDKILVDEKILVQPFACDVKKCKGACCTMEGGAGAPLLDSEIQLIEDNYKSAFEYISEESKTYIEQNGWLVADENGLSTTCIDDKDCVFVYYVDSVAKCSLEKAYFEGKSTFRKPISCHLFPIRVADFGGTYLYYEKIDECKSAISHGKQIQETVLDCAHDALERMLGAEWVEAATKHSVSHRTKK
ncbi:MAG: DUF3109 family protein [Candidatus Kapaibacterium sp.]